MSNLAAARESCGKRLPSPHAVVCTNCGFDTRNGTRIATKTHRLKDRGRARKAPRRSVGALARLSPWLFLLVQLGVSGVFLWIAYEDESARLAFGKFVGGHIAVAGAAILAWVVSEDGLIALFYPTALLLMSIAEDADPWVESLMFGAARSVAALGALASIA